VGGQSVLELASFCCCLMLVVDGLITPDTANLDHGVYG
jgi:hypothetical protein